MSHCPSDSEPYADHKIISACQYCEVGKYFTTQLLKQELEYFSTADTVAKL